MDTDLLGGCVRQVPECPQAVLHQTLTGACQVLTQSLHPTCREQRSQITQLSATSHQLSWRYVVDKKPLAAPVWLPCTHTQIRARTCTHMHTQVCAHRQHVLHTSLYNGRFVAWAHREDFENTACGPQQLLIAVVPHDVNETFRTSVGKDDELWKRKREKRLCEYVWVYKAKLKVEWKWLWFYNLMFYNSQLCDLSRQMNTTKSSHILLLLTDNHTHSHPTMPAPEQLCSHATPKTKTHAHTSSTTWTVSNYRSWLEWSVPAIVLCYW